MTVDELIEHLQDSRQHGLSGATKVLSWDPDFDCGDWAEVTGYTMDPQSNELRFYNDID